jgi:glycolate oxidase FAD binding subunit
MRELDLSALAAEVGPVELGPVVAVGAGTRWTPPAGLRTVQAPAGIVELRPEEMTVRCGAGTSMEVLAAALSEHGQEVALPEGGTVGGALAVGRSDVLRLGRGPVRDTLLQARYVNGDGKVVRAGGPTVKNVSGFDLCRLLVGSRGRLGVLGEVILRTRPLPSCRAWFVTAADPERLLASVYRPMSILWDGTAAWVCLEGHPCDVADQAAAFGLREAEGPPPLPTAYRWSIPPSCVPSLASTGRFVAEVGVGVVHHAHVAPPSRPPDPVLAALEARVRAAFDPAGRFTAPSGPTTPGG